ncbi:hypothetical protein P872_22660 [Rhodonellum psychrophilum GCM71 = DSM 17998]|uniref:Small multi-drug export protein n=2 Tax=Rhodonellum TaxID=336827 RepID=U5BW64_9BACT|nr:MULTISPECIES: hypothetical protein [Rhodonellum]ERM84865.1 hypothetical protein P872_22660 [Rhodonellum psychrophilum GCM71 = DSM 17998]MDO9552055.1 hypothetical protein [Rhodonellum sp.]SDY72185.1 hypothetical protein SAMN05444412_102364 [Rhodonellum ikkaensis]
MITYLLKFLGIYVICLFKFVAGPILGYTAGYGLFEIILVSVSGMMTTVILLTYLGDWFKAYWAIRVTTKKKRFTPKIRRIVKIWQKFGAAGIAFITPIFLTPIGGTIIMNAFGVKKNKIFLYMLISGLVWATLMGLSIEGVLQIPFFNDLLR